MATLELENNIPPSSRSPVWKIPPVATQEIIPRSFAMALAETIPRHVSQKGGVELRDKFDRGKGVVVCVLDTGISELHTAPGTNGDLQHAFKGAKDFTGSRWGHEDRMGHGTMCSGIIAADNDGVGTSSILDRCDLYMAKVLGDSGWGSTEWIEKAIYWAVDECKANVLSMSFGGGYSVAVHEALRYAVSKGCLPLAAAGNSGERGVESPAINNDSCLAISAIDFNHVRPAFSSVGTANDIADYGVGVYSTFRGGSYARQSGTSFSCPNAAAALGAIKALEIKHLGQPVVRDIQQTIDFLMPYFIDLGEVGHDKYHGHGYLNFQDMILTYEQQLMQPGPDPEPEPPPFEPIIWSIPRTIPADEYVITKKSEVTNA